jgi:hypothetical protein
VRIAILEQISHYGPTALFFSDEFNRLGFKNIVVRNVRPGLVESILPVVHHKSEISKGCKTKFSVRLALKLDGSPFQHLSHWTLSLFFFLNNVYFLRPIDPTHRREIYASVQSSMRCDLQTKLSKLNLLFLNDVLL